MFYCGTSVFLVEKIVDKNNRCDMVLSDNDYYELKKYCVWEKLLC